MRRESVARRRVFLVSILISAMAAVGGAQPTSPSMAVSPEPGPPPAPMMVGQPFPSLKIGAIMPLSGNLAAYGSSTLDGVKMMADEINKTGGVGGRQIELVIENNEGDTVKSADALRKLEGLNKVLAVIGPITSTNAMAVARDAQNKGVVLMTPTGTNDKITEYGDFIFRACFNDSFQGIAVARFAYEDLGLRSAVAFQDRTSDYSVGLCKSFSETFERLGGTMMPMESYKQGDTDFVPQLRKIRRAEAQALFVPGYPPELPLIVNQAKNIRLEATLLGADGWDNSDLTDNAGHNLQGSYFSGAFSTESKTPELEKFLALASARGIDDPRSFEALGYDSMGLVAQAALHAGALASFAPSDLASQRRALRGALASIENYKGATGAIAMQPSGDPLKSLVILRYDVAGDGIKSAFVKVVNP
ncbi:ABC transporter substrate-binding protein [Candidatus Sumerlaeota bacterium]|nr:ABC transporter substrate-binding protein [Candidatus Sumerlaeota bacterium]